MLPQMFVSSIPADNPNWRQRGLTSDLLRCAAMMFVFLLHAAIFLDDYVELPYPDEMIASFPAWAGIWIFLILSGFSIELGFLRKKIRRIFEWKDQCQEACIVLHQKIHSHRSRILPVHHHIRNRDGLALSF